MIRIKTICTATTCDRQFAVTVHALAPDPKQLSAFIHLKNEDKGTETNASLRNNLYVNRMHS